MPIAHRIFTWPSGNETFPSVNFKMVQTRQWIRLNLGSQAFSLLARPRPPCDLRSRRPQIERQLHRMPDFI